MSTPPGNVDACRFPLSTCSPNDRRVKNGQWTTPKYINKLSIKLGFLPWTCRFSSSLPCLSPLTSAHSRAYPCSLPLTPVPIPAHSRSLPHTPAHSRSLLLIPAHADARISMGEWQKPKLALLGLELFMIHTTESGLKQSVPEQVTKPFTYDHRKATDIITFAFKSNSLG